MLIAPWKTTGSSSRVRSFSFFKPGNDGSRKKEEEEEKKDYKINDQQTKQRTAKQRTAKQTVPAYCLKKGLFIVCFYDGVLARLFRMQNYRGDR